MIRLGWPHKDLSPNARKDRRAVTNTRKLARMEGFIEAKRAGVSIPADAHLVITFCPPNAVRRDLDNCLGSIKWHLDGIAAATCKDDAGWSVTLRKGDPVKNGAVLIRVAEADAWRSIGEIAQDMIKGEVA